MTSLNGFARRRWTGVGAAALVVVLAACGSQAKTVDVKRKPAPSPRQVLLASVRATTAAQSARMSMRMTASGGPGGESFVVTADGVADFVTGNGVLTMKIDGIGPELGAIEMRIVDGAAYMKMPESLGRMFGDGGWVKTPDLGAADHALPGLGQSDPSEFLAYLETVSNGVRKVGSDLIRGVETTHYAASLDLGKAVDHADVPRELRDELRKLLGKGSGASPIPADVWVDGDGLARRIELELNLGDLLGTDAPPGDDAPTMSVSMDLYDFGVPVNVVAPPADQVTELPFGAGDSVGNAGGAF
jgi:hypothetical protein